MATPSAPSQSGSPRNLRSLAEDSAPFLTQVPRSSTLAQGDTAWPHSALSGTTKTSAYLFAQSVQNLVEYQVVQKLSSLKDFLRLMLDLFGQQKLTGVRPGAGDRGDLAGGRGGGGGGGGGPDHPLHSPDRQSQVSR